MATELLSTCNLFHITPMNNYKAVTIKLNTSAAITANLSNLVVKAGLSYAKEQHYKSMDNIMDCDNKDYLRKTMLRHEEIFRDQLKELHRVYNVQKTMMTEMRNEKLKFQSASIVTSKLLAVSEAINRRSGSNSETSNSSPLSYMNHFTPQLNIEHGYLHGSKREDPSYKELSISSQDPHSHRVLRDFDLEQPAEEYAPKEARNTCKEMRIFGKQVKEKTTISCPQKCSDNESGLELTLSIGCRSEKSISSHHLHP